MAVPMEHYSVAPKVVSLEHLMVVPMVAMMVRH
jgi:hypothetical protein